MKKLLALLSIAAAVVLSAAPPAKAIVMPYILFQGGAYVPDNENMDSENADPGFAGNLAFGMRFLHFISGQVETGYMQTSGDNALRFSAIPLAVAVRLSLPLPVVEPYLIGGGGAYFTNAKLETEGGTTLFDEDSTEYGIFGGIGVNFNLGGFIIGGEGRYLMLDTDKIDANAFQTFLNVGFSF